MTWRAANRQRDETGALNGLVLAVDLVLWIGSLSRATLIYLLACIALGVLLGVASALTGIHPIPLLLGLVGLVLMLSCTFAPLLPDYDRYKDQRQG